MNKVAGIKIFSAFIVFVLSTFLYHCIYNIHEEFFYEAKEWAEKYGYELESHKYVSGDGFVTTIHRIPRGRKEDNITDRKPVLLQGGIFCASDHFLYLGPEYDLPFILADNGFDVWINNIRGNHYSKEHINGSFPADQYFDYNSWHRISQYDLPAAIDYVLNVTKKDQLDFIGYSMGNSIYMAMGSEQPKQLEKINTTIFMAPVLLKKSDDFITFLSNVKKVFDHYPLIERNYLRTAFLSFFIRESNFLLPYIMDHIDTFAGKELKRNATLFALVASHHPSGPSAAQIDQYIDNFSSGQFRMTNYGAVKNLEVYGQENPPKYNLKKITNPIHVFYAESDRVAGFEQATMIAKSLPNVVSIVSIKSPFAHYNFLVHNAKPPRIYMKIIKILKSKRR